MDKHSEVEAKFEANDLQVDQIQEWISNQSFKSEYEHVSGVDTFIKIGSKTIRVRNDYSFTNSRKSTCLTVKQRKNQTSMLDRKEVDVFLSSQSSAEDAEALFKMLDGEIEFRLAKTYYVWMINSGKYVICLALYDVQKFIGNSLSDSKERFLEVEIERHSACTEDEGKQELSHWINILQKQFALKQPVNYSLHERYK